MTKEANALLEKCERKEMDFFRDVLMSEKVAEVTWLELEWEAEKEVEKKR